MKSDEMRAAKDAAQCTDRLFLLNGVPVSLFINSNLRLKIIRAFNHSSKLLFIFQAILEIASLHALQGGLNLIDESLKF